MGGPNNTGLGELPVSKFAKTFQLKVKTMSETTPKKKTEYNKVTMSDGRVVEIPVSRKLATEILEGGAEGEFGGVRFDFVNGETRTLLLSELPQAIINYSAVHGLKQKIADDWAGAKDDQGQPASLEDIVLMCDEMMARLRAGDWAVQRAAGDSMAGASVVIRAISEVSGKTVSEVKALLDKRLEQMKADAEASGKTAPTRQKLYATFRNPASAIGKKIRELEEAKAAKNAVGDADALVAEISAS